MWICISIRLICFNDVDKEKFASIFNTMFLYISRTNLILFPAFCSQFPFPHFLNFFLCFVQHHRRILLYFIFAAFCITSSLEKHFRVLFFLTNIHARSSPVFSYNIVIFM